MRAKPGKSVQRKLIAAVLGGKSHASDDALAEIVLSS
jgi:hypothetical protein